MLPKSHPDFLKLSVVNTILGGYFGSRLMSNIREDKGYTYGIGSGLVPTPARDHFLSPLRWEMMSEMMLSKKFM
jgi:predicted Zn-dependent peptidase